MNDAFRRLDAVGVIVPARDEQLLLPVCLGALERAVEELQQARPWMSVRVLVVLDSCTDASAEIVAASRHGGLSVQRRCVGAARADGVAEVRTLLAPVPEDRLWLATTDADSAVPSNWLVHQIELAEAGAEAVLGIVAVDSWDGRAPDVRAAWAAGYVAQDGHHHVHGANLGLRADVYREAGGFSALPLHEDVELIRSLPSGSRVVRTAGAPVRTSARRDTRAAGGFGGFLDELEAG